MTLDLGYELHIVGAKDAQGRVQKLSKLAIEKIRKASEERAAAAVSHLQQSLDREYTSQWATHLIARGITYKAIGTSDGVNVKFYIANRRELSYITSALGGYFQHFPVGPFQIRPVNAKSLAILLPGGRARVFIRGKNGQFKGSRPGNTILVKQVMWGRKTGGFKRDVITEIMAQESAQFVEDVQNAVGIAIQQATG